MATFRSGTHESGSRKWGTGMSQLVKAIRTSTEEWGSYQERARLEGLPTNTWVRRALNDTVRLERTIERQQVLEASEQPAWTDRKERRR